jgi:hypothetical protein
MMQDQFFYYLAPAEEEEQRGWKKVQLGKEAK